MHTCTIGPMFLMVMMIMTTLMMLMKLIYDMNADARKYVLEFWWLCAGIIIIIIIMD